MCSRFFNARTHTNIHTDIYIYIYTHKAKKESGLTFDSFDSVLLLLFNLSKHSLTLYEEKNKKKTKKNRSSIYNALCYTCFCGATLRIKDKKIKKKKRKKKKKEMAIK